MTKPLDLNRLVAIARPAMYPEYVRVDSCIAMSRLVVEVLRHFGHPAEARRAKAVVFNRKMTELVDSEKINLEEPLPLWAEDAGAWNVGIGDGENGLHVVVISGGFMIDASLDQASRPEHDIVLEACAMPYKPGKSLIYEDDNGTVLTYKVFDDKDSFKASPDWRNFKSRYGAVAGQVIRQLKKEGF